MGVGGQVTACAKLLQQVKEDFSVALAGRQNSDPRLSQPIPHVADRLRDRQRPTGW